MENTKENRLGTQPIGSLVLSMSAPIMISMLVQALYNIVDTIYVTQYAQTAPESTEMYINATAYAMPVQFLMIAISVGTSVGMNSLLSLKLGQKDNKSAEKAAGNGLLLMVISSVFFILAGMFLTEHIVGFQTTNQEVLELSKGYTSIVMIFCTPLFIQVCFERILQATGNSFYSMIVQGVAAIINIILDPVLIFGYGIFPELGVDGAAIATVFAQFCGAVIAIIITKVKVKEINIKASDFKPDFKIIKEIYHVGIPTAIMQSVASFMLILMNFILKASPLAYQSALGVYFKIQSFVFMPVFGLNSGLIPIIAYNFGARKKERIVKSLRAGMLFAFIIMVFGTIIVNVFAENLMMMFKPSDELLAIGSDAFKKISYSFIFAGVTISFSSAFQALRKAQYSMIISIIRQIGLLVPAAYIIVKFFAVENVWYSFIIAEIPAFVLGIILVKRLMKNTVNTIEA
ncbi:MAG: MATE family efflux transporter [Clostridiales bacterium]|nr:MATE family efflux transporter [Clostridiales bacterium]